MSTAAYNSNPISLREGKAYIDGLVVADGIKCDIKFTPDVWTGRQLGERTPSSRWLGYSITGNITRRRSTKWLDEIIRKYRKDGVTPEFKIQGQLTDKNSDYYQKYKNYTVTCVGCVLTGDLPLIALDSGGEVLEDAISFSAKDIV